MFLALARAFLKMAFRAAVVWSVSEGSNVNRFHRIANYSLLQFYNAILKLAENVCCGRQLNPLNYATNLMVSQAAPGLLVSSLAKVVP